MKTQSYTQRYRPQYQQPEEFLAARASGGNRRLGSSSTATNATTIGRQSPSMSRGNSPEPVSMRTWVTPDAKGQRHTDPFNSMDTVAAIAEATAQNSSRSGLAPGPVATDEWARPFIENHPVTAWTPRRRVLDPSMLTPATPRGRASLSAVTPSALASLDRRRYVSHAAETTLFGVDFEDIARKRQALYLAEEGNTILRAANAHALKTYVTGASRSTLTSKSMTPSRVTFLDILTEKKRRERQSSDTKVIRQPASSGSTLPRSHQEINSVAATAPSPSVAQPVPRMVSATVAAPVVNATAASMTQPSVVLHEYLRLIARKPAISSPASTELLFSKKTNGASSALSPSRTTDVKPHPSLLPSSSSSHHRSVESPLSESPDAAAEGRMSAHNHHATFNSPRTTADDDVIAAASILTPSSHLSSRSTSALGLDEPHQPSDINHSETMNHHAQLVSSPPPALAPATLGPESLSVAPVTIDDVVVQHDSDSGNEDDNNTVVSLEAYHQYVTRHQPNCALDVKQHDHQLKQTLDMFGMWFSHRTIDVTCSPRKSSRNDFKDFGMEYLMSAPILRENGNSVHWYDTAVPSLAEAVVEHMLHRFIADRVRFYLSSVVS